VHAQSLSVEVIFYKNQLGCESVRDVFAVLRSATTSPVNLGATGATPELLVIDFREQLELFNYFGLGDLFQ
jgi:hypothetical protein